MYKLNKCKNKKIYKMSVNKSLDKWRNKYINKYVMQINL